MFYIKFNRKKFNLLKETHFNHIIKCCMQRAVEPVQNCLVTRLIPSTRHTTTNMSTLLSTKLKKNAAQDLSNDDTGNHTHLVKEVCIKTDCETKQCQTLCDTYQLSYIKGHNSHKPPIGRFCRFVSETDANGNAQPQYFVPSNQKKAIKPAEKATYGKNIKPDTKQQPFVDKHRNTYEQD